jgi:PAS domain S-box-containing protein
MNLKIRAKIVLITLVSLLLAIGINVTISSYLTTREYSDALRSRTLIIGQSLALQLDRLLKYGIMMDEVVGFEKQCQEIISEYKDVSYAMVVDTEGKILFHNDPSQRGKRLTDPTQLEAAKGAEVQILEVYPQPGEGYFDATIPVRDSRGQHVAAVKVGLPTRLVTQRTQALLLSSGAVALVSLGLAIILLFVMLPAWVTRPLAQLLAAVHEIGQKGAAGAQRVEIHSRDEVGQLASAFNSMAEQIHGLVSGLEQRTRELEASQRVTFAASERATPEELFDLVVNLIREQFDLYHAQVYTVDEQAQAAVLRQSTGYAGRQLLQRKHKIPLGATSLVTKVIHTGEPVLVGDVSQEPNFMPNPLLPETRSELVVPLKREGKVIGVLDTQDRTPGRFGKSTVALFQTMADQIAILFENSALLGRITEQSKRLSLFTTQLSTAAEVARRLSTILDPEYLLNETVELVNSRFGFYHVHLYLLDSENQLVVRAGSGEVGRVLKGRKHSIQLDHAKSVIARAARERVAQWVEDTTLESSDVPNPLLPQTRAELAVPLMAGDKVLGVLDIQDDEPGRFSQTERDTFATLAGQVATAQKSAEEAVRESRQLLQTVMDNIPQAIFWKDRNLSYLGCNRAFAADAGLASAQDILGKTDWDMPWEEQAELYCADDTRVMETGVPKLDYEEPQTTPNGTLIWLRTNKVPLRDAEGNVSAVLGMYEDITERKRAELEIQKRATDLKTVAEVSTAASTILETDRLLQAVVDLTKSNFNLYHAHIYLINEAGDTLTLAAGAGEVGRQMTAQGWQIPLNRERSLVAQAARNRQGVVANDVRAEPDYMPNPLLPDTRSELAVPLIMGDKVLGVLDVQSDRIGRFMPEDITIQSTLAAQVATALENARLFEEVKLTAERLQEVDRLKSEFLASMSHELRTPLNSIIGYSEVILMGINGAVDPETHEDLQAIYDNGQHLLTLINDILDLAKIEAGRMSLKTEPVDIATLLDEVKTKSVGLLHKNKKPIELIVTAEQDLEPIQADRLRLSQVLNNLVSNAIKFTDQGRVSLHAFRENGWM